MVRSKNLEEQLKKYLDKYRSDPTRHLADLRKKTFLRATSQLLNKNLNLIPTPVVYKKH